MKIFRFLLMMHVVMMSTACQNSRELTLLVGTYTGGGSEGIYAFRFDTEELTATPLGKAIVDNPSYLAISPDSRFVYTVSESGEENSAVSAFAFDQRNGVFTFLNSEKVGSDPCYILLDPECHYVATANYSGGSVSFVAIASDGRLSGDSHSLAFYGKGTDTVRQTKSHLHCLAPAADGQALFVTDLGADRISRIDIRTNSEGGALPDFSYNAFFDILPEPRSGPRHFIFNERGTRAYLINEISGKVMVFTLDPENTLEHIQTIVADTCYAEGSADIHLSPDEKFLYVSTRLEGDGIVIFKVDNAGQLSGAGYQATGKHPRNFVITPDGCLMLVACKDAGMIQIFRIDKQTGLLADTGKRIAIDQPVCLKLVK